MPQDITRSKSVPETILTGGNIAIYGNDYPFNKYTYWDKVHIQNTSSTSAIRVYINDDQDQQFNVSASGNATWSQAEINNMVIEAKGNISPDKIIISMTKKQKSLVENISDL